MSKRAKIITAIISGIIIIGGLVFYFFFPKIWGDILYPLEYNDYIIKYSKQFDVDPAFVAAVIYSESHFNPQAKSQVGAMGLMQIMPDTGRGIAAALGEPDFTVSKLQDPETNIRYGTWYLRDLLDSYGGDEEAALAGYNGGPGVANRFLVARDTSVIPRETSGYLRTVMNAKEKYQELYHEQLYGVPQENVAEKLKVQPTATPATTGIWQKIINAISGK